MSGKVLDGARRGSSGRHGGAWLRYLLGARIGIFLPFGLAIRRRPCERLGAGPLRHSCLSRFRDAQPARRRHPRTRLPFRRGRVESAAARPSVPMPSRLAQRQRPPSNRPRRPRRRRHPPRRHSPQPLALSAIPVARRLIPGATTSAAAASSQARRATFVPTSAAFRRFGSRRTATSNSALMECTAIRAGVQGHAHITAAIIGRCSGLSDDGRVAPPPFHWQHASEGLPGALTST